MSQLTREQFEGAELSVHREIAKRKWPKPALLILYVILERSFQRRWTRAHVPQLDFLKAATGIQRSHISEWLRWLEEMRVVLPGPGDFYGVNIDPQEWRVRLRPHLQGWDELHGPMELPADPPDLRQLLTEVFVERFAGERLARNLPDEDRGASLVLAPERTEPGRALDLGKVERDPTSSDPETNAYGPGAEAKPPPHWGSSGDTDGRPARSQSESGTVPNLGTDAVPFFGTHPGGAPAGSVPKKGTLCEMSNVDGATVRVPKKGTQPPSGARAGFPPHTPPSKSLNVERSTLNELKGVPKKGTARKLMSEENRLLELIAGFVGPQDMKHSGSMWRTRVVRNLPAAVIEEAVANGRYREQTGYTFRNKPAWLMTDIAKLAGVKSIGDLPPGPEPR